MKEEEEDNDGAVLDIQKGDVVRLSGSSDNDFLVGKVAYIRKSSQKMRMQWYYTKQDIFNDLDPDAFVGDYSQENFLAKLTDRDLVASNHYDSGNPIGSVLEHVEVTSETKVPNNDNKDSTTTGWICRFQMDIMHEEIHVYGIYDERHSVFVEEKKTHKKRVYSSDDDDDVPKKKKSRKNNRSTTATGGPVLSLWEIYDLSPKDNTRTAALRKIFPKHLSFDVQQVAHFFLFIHERQEIWERRHRGDPEPWSQSSAMTKFFFCNNYRELDRGTNYFRHEMLNLKDRLSSNVGCDDAITSAPRINHKDWFEQVFWASVCYRLMNKVETFLEYGGIPTVTELKKFKRFLNKLMNGGTIIFTGAHINMGLNRYNMTLQEVQKDLPDLVSKMLEAYEEDPDTALEECYHIINGIRNIGPFFAWQITCDLLECQCLPQCDENDFCKLGNGAEAGLKLTMRIKPKKEDQLTLVQMLQARQGLVYDCLGVKFSNFRGQSMTLKNIEHALCEFQKYISIQSKLQKRQSGQGQRLKKSRVSLDQNKVCNNSDCKEQNDLQVCLTCRDAYCSTCCQPEQQNKHWSCQRCIAFEGMKFVSEVRECEEEESVA